jgi:hypothetical protein
VTVKPFEDQAMRFPRVKLTVGRLMLFVALVSVLMGLTREVTRLRRLSREYSRKAVLAVREEREWRGELFGSKADEAEARRLSIVLRAKDQELADLWASKVPIYQREVREARAILAHQVGLRRKYERAASCPWEPVAPDPAEPRKTFRWTCGFDTLPKEPLPPGKRWYSDSENDLLRLLRRTNMPR